MSDAPPFAQPQSSGAPSSGKPKPPEKGKPAVILTFMAILAFLAVLVALAASNYHGSSGKLPSSNQQHISSHSGSFSFTVGKGTPVRVAPPNPGSAGEPKDSIQVDDDVFLTEYALAKSVSLTSQNYPSVYYSIVTLIPVPKGTVLHVSAPKLVKFNGYQAISGKVVNSGKQITNNVWLFFNGTKEVQVNCEHTVTPTCQQVLQGFHWN